MAYADKDCILPIEEGGGGGYGGVDDDGGCLPASSGVSKRVHTGVIKRRAQTSHTFAQITHHLVFVIN